MMLGKIQCWGVLLTWIIAGQEPTQSLVDEQLEVVCIVFSHLLYFFSFSLSPWDGAKVLGKLPGPGPPTNLDYTRARAYYACSRCGWGLFGHFFSHLSLLFSSSLSLGDGPI